MYKLINILKHFKSIYLLIILFVSCLTQTVFSQLPTYLPSDSLVGWWPFNGNANDESGNGNNGLVNGASLTEDRFGNAGEAYRFDGLTSVIEILDAPTLSLLENFSISSWFQYDSLNINPGQISSIVNKHEVGNDQSGYTFGLWQSSNAGNGLINFSAPPHFDALTYPSEPQGVVQPNQWYQAVVTYDDNSDVLSYYLNGILIDTIALSLIIDDNNYNLIFGSSVYMGNNSPNWNYFNGNLDDIGIWNRVLSPTEVYNLYQANCTLSATIQSPPAVAGCEGDAVSLTAHANSSCQYQWYKDGQILPSATDSTLLASGSGWYTVKAISSFCESKDSVQIIQFPLPEVNAGSDQALCAGSSIILNGSGATTYSWNNGAQDGIAFVPNGNMSYVLTGTDSNGCIGTDTVSVSSLGSNAYIELYSNSDGGLCNGMAITQTNYSSNFTVIWSNGRTVTTTEAQDSCSNLCPGPFSVSITDNVNQCSFSLSGVIQNTLSVTDPLAGYLNLTNADGNAPCSGEANIIAYGGVPPYQYQFMDVNGIISGSSNNADSLCPGVYTFKIFDSQQDSLNISFLICDSSSIFSIVDPDYQDSLILDTLVVSLIENCEIDFASVDSVWISSYSYLGTDSLVVSWNVQDSAGIHEILNYYNISNCQGVFNLELSIFCPQKSLDNPYLKAYDQLYINDQTASINSPIQEVLKVWPNPFTNELFVELTSNELTDYFIMDAFGRVVVKGTLSPAEHQLDLHNLMSGIYFLCVGQKKIKVEKLLTSQH